MLARNIDGVCAINFRLASPHIHHFPTLQDVKIAEIVRVTLKRQQNETTPQVMKVAGINYENKRDLAINTGSVVKMNQR